LKSGLVTTCCFNPDCLLTGGFLMRSILLLLFFPCLFFVVIICCAEIDAAIEKENKNK